ncbi:MAG: hypothetical protein H6765_11355 [Candidatus Peribacteria bacterium]|nr:MAG: hypothetical protein H6765_11355 [Candidatus Peribacteria bacterium]
MPQLTTRNTPKLSNLTMLQVANYTVAQQFTEGLQVAEVRLFDVATMNYAQVQQYVGVPPNLHLKNLNFLCHKMDYATISEAEKDQVWQLLLTSKGWTCEVSVVSQIASVLGSDATASYLI